MNHAPATELTVLIPSSRPLQALKPTLEALADQSLAANRFDVVVVLDGPDDGRAAGLRQRGDPFRLTTVTGPGRGRAAACNAGLAAVRGAVVLLLDDDMAPQRTALAAHLARHVGSMPQGVMGAVPVRVPFGGSFAARYIARRFSRHMAKLAAPNASIRARDVYTGAFSIPRHTLEHLGGFDEGFRDYGNEDGELAGRLLRLGIPIVFAPEAVSLQTYDKSFAALAADNLAKGRTACRFAELHPDRAADSGLERIRRGSARRRGLRQLLAYACRSAVGRRLVLAVGERLATALERMNPRVADVLAGVVLEACFQHGVGQARATATRRTVVHYCDSARAGGAERVALTLAAGLDRARWRPILVLHDYPALQPLLAEARARGVECRVERRGRPGLLVTVRLASTFRRLRPAVAHIHRTWAPSGTTGILAAALARVPVRVTTEHLYLSSTPRRAIWLRRLVIDHLVHRHIAVSRALADALRTRLHVRPNRIAVVPNGIVPAAAPSACSIREVRQRLAVPDGAPLVLVPAQLRRQKGHDILLQALLELPGVVAAFAGEGPERTGLAAQARAAGTAGRVRFLGFRDDLPVLLAAADVVVLPSSAEGLPLAVLEALALGRPVVASAVGGTPEAIRHGVNGLLVPPLDAPALAASIRALLADPARATRLGEAGRESIRASFAADRMIGQTAQLYDELLDGGTVPRSGSAAIPDDNGRLRATDWRFLTGNSRFNRLLVLARADASASAAVATEVITGAAVTAGSCDAALAVDADDAALRAAHTALRPSGVACLRFAPRPGRSPGRLVDHVRRAGFATARPYAAWPSARSPRAWLPLDDAGARSRLLGGEASATLRSRAGQLRRRLWEVRAMHGFGGPVAVIARRDRAAGDGIEERVREAWPRVFGVKAPDHVSWTLLTGGTASLNKVVAVAVARDTAGPGIVVKWPRTAEAGAGLAREAYSLRLLARTFGDALDGVPRLLFEAPTPEGPALGQTLLPGTPLTRRLDRHSCPVFARLAADWLAQLALAAPPLARSVPSHIATHDVDAFLACVEPALDAGLVREGLALLDGLAGLRNVTEHRDFAPWNVLVDDSAVGLVDWESSVAAGLPLLDLWYFLTHLALFAQRRRISALGDAYGQLIDPDQPIGRMLEQTIERYAAAVAVPADAIPALRAATWMVHVPSEIRRLTATSHGVVTHAQIRRATFVRLWEIEVLRAVGTGRRGRGG